MKKLANIRFPTILGIIIILIGIPLTTFILKNQTVFKSNASNLQEPQNVKITNISDNSFTVTYQTDAPVTDSISYGHDNKLGESELDDIDKAKGSFSPKEIHSISMTKLTPSTKYYLAIISGSDTFLNNGSLFEITTGPNIASSSAEQNTLKGKIVLPNGSAPSEALVYLNTANSQFLSTTVTRDGEFNFSLKDIRAADLSSYLNINEDTIFKITATNGSLKSTASVSLTQTGSIPIITLSNNYDFIQEALPKASQAAEPSLGFPSIAPAKESSKPKILSPKENQSFTDQKPQFRGTSLPNEKVEIIIHSTEEITTQITADNNGNWTYKPSDNLSPGVHTITIKTRDASGILTTIMQSFTVFAADSQPTPPVTPTQIVTPIPTLTPTPFPTITILIPTPTSTPMPILSPAPIESKGGLSPTGSSPILLIVGGIAATLTGFALFLFTRRISL